MEFDIESRLAEIEDVCVRRGVVRLSLFGSAVDGGFDVDRSDIDFVVEFESMRPVEHKRAYFGLLSDLEALFGRGVDLVEPKAVENPFIRESIEASRKVVYAAA